MPEIKADVAAEFGMPEGVFTLQAAGRVLDARESLADAGLSANSTLTMVARVPGGSQPDSSRHHGEASDAPPLRPSTHQSPPRQAVELEPPPTVRRQPAAAPAQVSTRGDGHKVVFKPLPEAAPSPTTPERPQAASSVMPTIRPAADAPPAKQATTAPSDRGSPQPTSAARARALAANDIVKRLSNVDTPYALYRDSPVQLASMVGDAYAARVQAIPKGTLGADENGMRWAISFGIESGNRWMRPRSVVTADEVLTEVMYTCCLLIHIAHNIGASAKRKAAGFTQGSPNSALLAVYGWQRVQRDCHRYTCDMKSVGSTLLGLCVQYKAIWGDAAFVRIQAQPLAMHMLLAIAAACAELRVSAWLPPRHDAWAVINKFLASTGTRTDEWTDGSSYLRRSNFVLLADDLITPLEMSPGTIASRRNGHMLRGMCGASKCDRLLVEWGVQKQHFRYDDTNPMNFAKAWCEWELAHPCPVDSRAAWAAFSPTGEAAPFSSSEAHADFKLLIRTCLIPTDLLEKWLHSYRVTLATALAAARAAGKIEIDDGVIQVLERWKSPQSMRQYTRMTATAYADYVEIGTTTDTRGARRDDVPEIDAHGVISELDEICQQLLTNDAVPRAPRSTAASAASAESNAGDRFTVGDEEVVASGDDSWKLVGTRVNVPNSFWSAGAGSTDCLIAAFLLRHSFPDAAAPAYVVTDDTAGHHYIVRSSYLLRILPDAEKRRLGKAPPPKLRK